MKELRDSKFITDAEVKNVASAYFEDEQKTFYKRSENLFVCQVNILKRGKNVLLFM